MELQLFREHHLVLEDSVYGLGVVLRLKGRETGHQLEEGDPHCPEVHHLVVSPSRKHLRSPVVRSSSQGQHLPLPAPLLNFFAYSKIDEFNLSAQLIVKDVLRFDISMTDLISVQVFNGLKELMGNIPQFFL